MLVTATSILPHSYAALHPTPSLATVTPADLKNQPVDKSDLTNSLYLNLF